MFEKSSDNKYYYQNNSKGPKHGNGREVIGNSLNFAAREAYKQLRTNLEFSLADIEGCKCIGITSAIRGDGKSLSSINLGLSLSEYGCRVILLEGDLRIPSLGSKLNIHEEKGLSSILAGENGDSLQNVVRVADHERGCLDIMLAGVIPPNPQELLGSARMQTFIEFLKGQYDYIIVDLPPVNIVADALVASKALDGMVLVVRHNHTERGALAEALRQLEFGNVNILGFIFNAAGNEDGGYYKRYKHRYYHKGYSRGYYGSSHYGYGYAVSDRKENDRHTHPSDSGN